MLKDYPDDWKGRQEARQEMAEDKYETRRQLANEIAAAGYNGCVIEFSGSGDSGSIDSVSFDNAGWSEKGYHTNHDDKDPLVRKLYDFADMWLEGVQVDWYNNEGGQGHIQFDVESIPYKFECSVDYNVVETHNGHYEEEVA